MGFFGRFNKTLLLFSCLFLKIVDGFYLPGSFPDKYDVGDRLSVKVNSLTSIDTEIPYGYYTLPFCWPPEGSKDSAENIGELLMGDRMENSLYRFKMLKNESEMVLCRTNPLSVDEFKTLKERIDDMYRVNLILDNLPAIRYTKKDGYFLRWTGYPVGIKVKDVYYVFNHLKFTVLVHEYKHNNVVGVIGTGDAAELITHNNETNNEGYMVVGFEVQPCSVNHDVSLLYNVTPYGKYAKPIKCDPASVAMDVTNGRSVTYEVSFVLSDIKWPSRWDAYLKMEGAKVYWFSILNLLMVITFLAGVVLVIFSRTIRRDLAHYEELDEAQNQMNEELSGRKLVVSDVFQTPTYPKLLCVVVVDGCRILVWRLLPQEPGISENPIRTNQIPREIPAPRFPSSILVLGAGTLQFGTLFIELFFIMSSIWLGRVYYVFGFLFVVLILLVTVCAEVSLVLTYMHLCVEDWNGNIFSLLVLSHYTSSCIRLTILFSISRA